MAFFSKKDVDTILQDTNSAKSERLDRIASNKKIADQIREAMLYALDCYMTAISELPTICADLGIKKDIITKYSTKKVMSPRNDPIVININFFIYSDGSVRDNSKRHSNINELKSAASSDINTIYNFFLYSEKPISLNGTYELSAPEMVNDFSKFALQIKPDAFNYSFYLAGIESEEKIEEKVKAHFMEGIKKLM